MLFYMPIRLSCLGKTVNVYTQGNNINVNVYTFSLLVKTPEQKFIAKLHNTDTASERSNDKPNCYGKTLQYR